MSAWPSPLKSLSSGVLGRSVITTLVDRVRELIDPVEKLLAALVTSCTKCPPTIPTSVSGPAPAIVSVPPCRT